MKQISHNSRICWAMVIIAFGAVTAAAAETPRVCVPLGGGPNGIDELQVAAFRGVCVSVKRIRDTGDGPPAARVTFRIEGEERRMMALMGDLASPPVDARVMALSCRLSMEDGNAPQLALLAFERDGGVWYRISRSAVPTDRHRELRIPLAGGFQRALFAADNDTDVNWDQVERVWIALLVDGPAAGTWDVRRAVFTNEPFRPSEPLEVWGEWSVAQDSAVRGAVVDGSAGPDGRASMQYSFELPGGRHMYAIPRLPVDVEELDAYSGLRFTYRATLPEGIDGLLVMLIEADGTQYYASPAPPASESWSTITIPLSKFRRGGWSADENDRLDLRDVRYVTVGMHGTARPAKAAGTIDVTGVQFVP